MASYIEFEYINEDSINRSLKCAICNQPFVRPVSTKCKKKHKFCRQCIEKWLHKNPTCPTCRQNLKSEDLISITETIVVDVLNELQVKCTGCGQTGLDRGDFDAHIKTSCPMVSIPCSAEDIKCPWVGPRNQFASHLKKCAFESLRPLISPLISENQGLKEQITRLTNHVDECQREMYQLKKQINQQATKIDGQHNDIIQMKNALGQNSRRLTTSKNPMLRELQATTSLGQPQLDDTYSLFMRSSIILLTQILRAQIKQIRAQNGCYNHLFTI